eukprot:NODE_3916_length_836_cov_105.193230_g3893_i0.p1 GENE.NODE_3916_length_836_cov_105.193230_g3893_i0~~NODE_3916_length_836_cov_105.193230_g3893_i0.p1  ORF type:complete len:134 (+),score=31.35 NODE_3916_length_836_cov_105.193230_g3893_i0:396-797(+)
MDVTGFCRKGDYSRYMNEVRPSKETQNIALDSYSVAEDLAKSLPAAHPLRLALALNFGVLYYETLGQKDKGLATTKAALEDAQPEVQRMSEDQLKEVGFALGMLQDNVIMWSKEMGVPLPQPPPGAQAPPPAR